MSLNNQSSLNDQTTANLFSTYFSSVYSVEKVDLVTDDMGISTFDLPNKVTLSVREVFRQLLVLRNDWSIGPDGLSGHFLYELRSIIAYPLWILFQRSLDEGTFPSMLKFSSVTPIFKSGYKIVVSN